MSEFKDGYIPIQYANGYKTRFVIPFPEYVKPEHIGVNLGRLDTLLRVGGISHLRVVGQTNGNTTKFTPTIVGYDSQGNAYAGKKGEKITVPEFSSSEDEANTNLDASVWRPHAATWKNVVINLNVNEMAERIRQEDKWSRGVYSTEAWAHHLDKDIREGVASMGIKHLALGFNKYNRISTSIQYALMGLFEASSGHPSVESMAFRVPFVSQFLNVIDYFSYRNTDDGYRWSTFYGPQLDRALLLKVLSCRTNLVTHSSENLIDSNPQSPIKIPTMV